MKPPINSAGRWILFSAVLWAVTYIACLAVVKEMHPSKTTGIILSFLPTITFILFLFHFIKAVRAMDEVQARIQMEAVVVAFTLGLLMLMTLGLLDLVVTLKKEDWGYRHLVPYFFMFYLIGIIVAKRKYT